MKSKHELFVCEDFLKFYNMNSKAKYSVVRHGRQGNINEPDCVCSDGLNIEIVGIYYNEDDAKLDWQLARKKITIQQSNESRQMYINPDQQAFSFLEKELSKKERKMAEGKYQYVGKMFLLIDARDTAITEFKDYDEYFKQREQVKSKFDEVWLRAFVNCCRESKFLKIFPK